MKPLALIAFLFLCTSFARADETLDGDWAGGWVNNGNWAYVQVHLTTAKEKTSGTVDLIEAPFSLAGLTLNKNLKQVEVSPSHIHFQATIQHSRFSFDGKLVDGAMTGIIQREEKSFPLHLGLMAKANLDRYVGIYQISTGHYIGIYQSPLASSFLFAFDSTSGQLRPLYPKGEGSFFCGSGPMTDPVEATVQFTTDEPGQCVAMEWKEGSAAPVVYEAVRLLRKDVSFANGGTILAGTLVLPNTKGPHPAVVFVHGSGPSSRKDFGCIADFYAMNGVATLAYDKRGVGASKGDWRVSGFDDLSGDALAAVEFLKNRPDINPHQIGLCGFSQGGWIVGLAASCSTDIGFIVSVSGAGITPEDQVAFTIEHLMRTKGFSERDIQSAISLYRLRNRCMGTGSGCEEYRIAEEASKNTPWYRDGSLYRGPNDQLWHLIWNYDPVPALEKVHCPVLAMWGEVDSLVPSQKSEDIWKAALARAGNRDVTLKMFPNAEHCIADPQTYLPFPDFFSVQQDWILKHLQVSP